MSKENTIQNFNVRSEKGAPSSKRKAEETLSYSPDVDKQFNTTQYEYDTFMCTCDLTKSSCDINCCCDEECSRKDLEAFKGSPFSSLKVN